MRFRRNAESSSNDNTFHARTHTYTRARSLSLSHPHTHTPEKERERETGRQTETDNRDRQSKTLPLEHLKNRSHAKKPKRLADSNTNGTDPHTKTCMHPCRSIHVTVLYNHPTDGRLSVHNPSIQPLFTFVEEGNESEKRALSKIARSKNKKGHQSIIT